MIVILSLRLMLRSIVVEDNLLSEVKWRAVLKEIFVKTIVDFQISSDSDPSRGEKRPLDDTSQPP